MLSANKVWGVRKDDVALKQQQQQLCECDELHKHVTSTLLNHHSQHSKSDSMIPNSNNFYTRIKLRCGVVILCRPEVLTQCRQILEDLESDLQDCFHILPLSVHDLIRRTRIWVNHTYIYGPTDKPITLDHTTAHHHENWLLCAGDRPDKALGIEIYNCFEFRRMRLHWNGCGLLMHELCHLIHQVALPQGLDNEKVNHTYERAKTSKLYQRVLRRDWAGKDLDYDMAYALVDRKEFFAEMSVTYFSHGYDELSTDKFFQMEQCSPPICEPNVQARVRDNHNCNDQNLPCTLSDEEDNAKKRSRPLDFFRRVFPIKKVLPHCNKFYPFTRHQFLVYDPVSFGEMEELWTQINNWEDPLVIQRIQCWSHCLKPKHLVSPDTVWL